MCATGEAGGARAVATLRLLTRNEEISCPQTFQSSTREAVLECGLKRICETAHAVPQGFQRRAFSCRGLLLCVAPVSNPAGQSCAGQGLAWLPKAAGSA